MCLDYFFQIHESCIKYQLTVPVALIFIKLLLMAEYVAYC